MTKLFFLCFLFLSFSRVQGISSSQHVHARLIAEVKSVKPGSRFCVAVALTMEDGWHIYWKNPGDSGLPTTVEWNLPEGFSAGKIQWPRPHRFETSGIVSFGYENEVFLITDMQAPVTLEPGTVIEFSARAEWLTCKEECVPEHADLSIKIPVKDHDPELDAKWAAYFKRSRENLPMALEDWNINASTNGEKIVILALQQGGENRSSLDMFFFPEEEGLVDYAEPQTVEKLRNGFSVEIKRSNLSSNLPSRLKGILYSAQGWDASGQILALLVDVPLQRMESI